MARFGYTLMTEQSGPRQLVDYAVSAEQAGFDFEVSGDHFSPWFGQPGARVPTHGPCWARSPTPPTPFKLYSYVTCPTMRVSPGDRRPAGNHLLQILADGRFTLGLGSGENLNEHVVGQGWPTVDRRLDMLAEAIKLIRELLSRELIDFTGEFYEVSSAPHLGCARGPGDHRRLDDG